MEPGRPLQLPTRLPNPCADLREARELGDSFHMELGHARPVEASLHPRVAAGTGCAGSLPALARAMLRQRPLAAESEAPKAEPGFKWPWE